ncbi:MAG: SPOR domain-containing protein [Dokdonella sp.]
MLVRVIVLLLLVLNIGALAWIASTYRDAPTVTRTENANGVPSLVLLSERDAIGPIPELLKDPASAQADDVCTSIGPFSNRSAVRSAIIALTPLTRRIQFREGQLERSRGWWVFLPTFPDRNSALASAREMSERGVKDYYVITAGDQQNTVSLGLFRDRDNAEKRQRELAALGVQAEIGERTELDPGFWIDFAQPGDTALDWRAHVGTDTAIEARSIDCF